MDFHGVLTGSSPIAEVWVTTAEKKSSAAAQHTEQVAKLGFHIATGLQGGSHL